MTDCCKLGSMASLGLWKMTVTLREIGSGAFTCETPWLELEPKEMIGLNKANGFIARPDVGIEGAEKEPLRMPPEFQA